MANRKLKVAVVGASISNSPDGRERFTIRAHLPALKKLSDIYDPIAVCTTRMESANAAARRFDIPHAFDSVERMLKELPELDVVCVGVRPVVHHQVVMAALHAGKHVYCEQPLGVTTAQAEEMSRLARKKNVRTIVGHQMHYEPAVLQMAEMIRDGYIGKPLSFCITFFHSGYIAPRPGHRQWLFQSEMGGHPAYRSGHDLERVTAVLGADVAEICSDLHILMPEIANLEGGAPLRSNQVDNMNFLIRLNNGVIGTSTGCHTAWFGTGGRFEVYGTEGMLMLGQHDTGAKDTVKGDPNHGELKLYGNHVDMKQMLANPTAPELLQRQFKEITPDEKHVTVHGLDRGRATFATAQAWTALANAIHSGKDCAPSFHDKLKLHYVWDATEISMKEGRWVKVDYSRLDA